MKTKVTIDKREFVGGFVDGACETFGDFLKGLAGVMVVGGVAYIYAKHNKWL